MTISEPSAEHRSGRKLYTLNNPAKLAPLQDIVVNDALMHPPITGEVRVNPSNLDTVLRGATPVAPGDPRIDGWAYSPLSSATFRVNGRAWSVKFFLGGLGELTDDAGRRAAFMFVLPSS